jgi:hypothetical protein
LAAQGGGAEADSSALVQRFQERCSCRSRITERQCAQKGAIAEGFVAAGPPKSGGAEADSAALVQRP